MESDHISAVQLQAWNCNIEIAILLYYVFRYILRCASRCDSTIGPPVPLISLCPRAGLAHRLALYIEPRPVPRLALLRLFLYCVSLAFSALFCDTSCAPLCTVIRAVSRVVRLFALWCFSHRFVGASCVASCATSCAASCAAF